MSEEKFFTSDMELDALLNGRHWDDLFPKKKVQTFDPIYGPTPFKPTDATILAMFDKQTCITCGGVTTSYMGLFIEHCNDKGEEEYLPYKGQTAPRGKMIALNTNIPFCWDCK